MTDRPPEDGGGDGLDSRAGDSDAGAADRDAGTGDGDADDGPAAENQHGHPENDHHDHHAQDLETVGVALVTVSSTRSVENDPAGDAVIEAVDAAGHAVVHRELVPDEYDRVQTIVNRLVDRDDVDVVIISGGTGVTPDDVTVEAVERLYDKSLPGFGELFRRLSYDEIGTTVVATRATAGVLDGVPVFALPGSEDAARLGAGEIILEEAPHLAGLATREVEEGTGKAYDGQLGEETSGERGSEKAGGEGLDEEPGGERGDEEAEDEREG